MKHAIIARASYQPSPEYLARMAREGLTEVEAIERLHAKVAERRRRFHAGDTRGADVPKMARIADILDGEHLAIVRGDVSSAPHFTFDAAHELAPVVRLSAHSVIAGGE